MGKVSRVLEHLSVSQIDRKMKETVGFWRVRRWLVIRHALTDPCPARVIAQRVGMSTIAVQGLISQYNRRGPEAVEAAGRGQRQRAYLSLDQERAFLQPFVQRAASGQVPAAAQIGKALEKRLGRAVSASTVYRLLKRQGWRKLVPRPRHVQSRTEVQEAFKKTSPKR